MRLETKTTLFPKTLKNWWKTAKSILTKITNNIQVTHTFSPLLFRYITTMADPEVMFMYGGAFASTKKNRELALKTLKELGTSNTCDLIKNKPDDALKMTKELNSKVDALAPIRQNFINALVEITRPESKITPAIGAW